MAKPFWENGIRFECQGCGNCCRPRNAYGYVYLTREDRVALSRHVGLSLSSFTRRYCDYADGYHSLKNPDHPCAFLEGDGCSAYDVRPIQCRTWPFWPENMNRRTWNNEVEPFCPGIGRGRLYSAREIRDLVRLQKSSE